MAQFKREIPEVLAFDAGNLGREPWKVEAILDAMGRMGYDAVALQAPDEELGDGFWRGARQYGVPCVGRDMKARWFPICVDGRAGPQRVVLVSGSEWSNAMGVAAREAAAGSRSVDVLVCLGAPVTEAGAVSRAARRLFGPGCAVVLGGAFERGLADANAVQVPIGCSGLAVAVVRGTRDAAATWHWSIAGARVTADVPADPRIQRVIEAHYSRHQARFLASAAASGQNGAAVRHAGEAVRIGARQGYVPAWGCRDCHPEAFRRWQGTGHARAQVPLRAKGRVIPECLACHCEEYRRTGKVTADVGDASSPEGGVECSACHGDGVVHAALGTAGTGSRGTLVSCTLCYTRPRSPRFGGRAYWARIGH